MADNQVEFEGQTFDVQTGPLNEFIVWQFMDYMAAGDADAEVPFGLLIKLLKATIAKKQWRQFERLAEQSDNFSDKAAQILAVRMKGPVQDESAHPTGVPSVSTDGQSTTPPKSVSVSDAKVIELSHGRPDRYWMLKEAQKAAAARSA